MSRPSPADAVLVVVVLASAALALARSRDVPLVTTAIAQDAPPVVAAPAHRASVTRAALPRSPFRLDGTIPSRRYGEAPVALANVQPEHPAAVYAVVVKALVGGPPWAAIVSGLPGEPTDRVVRVGDRLGPVSIERISADAVHLATSDTSWVVRLPERRP